MTQAISSLCRARATNILGLVGLDLRILVDFEVGK